MNQQVLDAAMSAICPNESYRLIEELPVRWHEDIQFKVEIGGKCYIARVMDNIREFNCIPPINLDNDMLCEQLELGQLFRKFNIPFMSNFIEDSFYKMFQYKGNSYRLVIHEWISGDIVKHSSEILAFSMGKMTHTMHDVSKGKSFKALVETSGKKDFVERLKILEKDNPKSVKLNEYISFARNAIKKGFGNDFELIAVHGDLNYGNIVLDENNRISGIIDFDSIGLSSRINEFAGVMKWYSRNEKKEYDERLAKKVWEGYEARNAFCKDELLCLPFIAWLRNGLTNKFIKYFLQSIPNNTTDMLIDRYFKKGNELYGICERLIYND